MELATSNRRAELEDEELPVSLHTADRDIASGTGNKEIRISTSEYLVGIRTKI